MKVDYVIQKEKRRSISICVAKDGTVHVKAPVGMALDQIQKFMLEKRSWILKKLEQVENDRKNAQKMGLISLQKQNQLRKQARRLISQRVEYYANLMGINYGKIRFGFQKTRWGSCSASGNLNFNCLLALMPTMAMDSVVVHELCHRRHMNHSAAFYQQVLQYFPDYYKWDKWLKENGQSYFMRLP